jgi:hypothetical protein
MKEQSEMMNEACSSSQEKKIRLAIGDMRIELIDYDNNVNRKVLSILGRELTYVKTGKPVFTHQEVADKLGMLIGATCRILHGSLTSATGIFRSWYLVRTGRKRTVFQKSKSRF